MALKFKIGFMPEKIKIKMLKEILDLLDYEAQAMLEQFPNWKEYDDVTGILTSSITSIVLYNGLIHSSESIDETHKPDPLPPGKRSSGVDIVDLSGLIQRTVPSVVQQADKGNFNLIIMTPVFYALPLEVERGYAVLSTLARLMTYRFETKLKPAIERIVQRSIDMSVEYLFNPQKLVNK
jgi:hypothetical protein